MLKKIIASAASLVLFFGITNVYAASDSPVGFWKTIDDVSNQAKSIIQIQLLPDHTLMGKVVRVFQDPERRCEACTGAAHNQPILGLVVMTQLKQSQENPNDWTGGEILDPRNGKIYHCSLHLVENGRKLQVRGYLGLPLFGRSQTWLRTESAMK